MDMNKQNLFFCYDIKLFKYIKNVKGIDYLSVAKHPKTDKLFSIFYKSNELQAAINEYRELEDKSLIF